MGPEAKPANIPGKPEPTSEEEAADGAENFVKRADMEQAIQKLHSDLRAANGREMKELRELVGKVVPVDSPAGPDAGGRKASEQDLVVKAAQERLAALKDREEKQQKKAMRLQIREALREAGADPGLAEMAVPSILEQESGRFSVSETQFGDYEVRYGEESAAIGDWAKAFLNTETGKRIKSRRPVPSATMPDGSRAHNPNQRQVPASMAKHLSDEELASGKVEIVPG